MRFDELFLEDKKYNLMDDTQKVEHNKKLLEKYPWLAMKNPWTNEYYDDYSTTWMDRISPGWRNAFGLMLINDIDKFKKDDEIVITDIKEKYGSLRFNIFSGNDDVFRVIEKYEMVSSFVCEFCGKVGTQMIDPGWIQCICLDCLKKTPYWSKNIDECEAWYKEQIDPEFELPEMYEIKITNRNGQVQYLKIDISYIFELIKKYQDLSKK